jgi:hypothetical protein
LEKIKALSFVEKSNHDYVNYDGGGLTDDDNNYIKGKFIFWECACIYISICICIRSIVQMDFISDYK